MIAHTQQASAMQITYVNTTCKAQAEQRRSETLSCSGRQVHLPVLSFARRHLPGNPNPKHSNASSCKAPARPIQGQLFAEKLPHDPRRVPQRTESNKSNFVKIANHALQPPLQLTFIWLPADFAAVVAIAAEACTFGLAFGFDLTTGKSANG